MCQAAQGVWIPQRPLPKRVLMEEKGLFSPEDMFILQVIKVSRGLTDYFIFLFEVLEFNSPLSSCQLLFSQLEL